VVLLLLVVALVDAGVIRQQLSLSLVGHSIVRPGPCGAEARAFPSRLLDLD
jgi:hypothetical protein